MAVGRVFGVASLAAICALALSAELGARQGGLERLPRHVLDVIPPAAHVRGEPGRMSVQPGPCREFPNTAIRRRIVNVAVQEWAFFGFRIVDRTEAQERTQLIRDVEAGGGENDGRLRFRRPRLSPDEAARVASSIAGYWAVTPEGGWIVQRQNDDWTGADGIAARWNAPWSAAFISWVMCEAGLASTDRFRRAIAHHSYIDQAIRGRDNRSSPAAFVAYDTGEETIVPGDLLCTSRRPLYRTLADRRRQMGAGARTHCDIVVKVDESRERILAIGGNVRGIVSLKLLRAQRAATGALRVVDPDEERPIFAHLKLRAAPIEADPLATSATMQAFRCVVTPRVPAALAAAEATAVDLAPTRC